MRMKMKITNYEENKNAEPGNKKMIGMTTNRKAMVQERNGSSNMVQWLSELRQSDT